MLESVRLLDHILERDLDLILVSALFSSERFRAFVIKSAIGWEKGHSLVQTCVSEVADAGETDVLLVVDLEGADRLGVMIEDKISAPFQPEQAARYRQRGEQGTQDGRWNRYTTCVCAPEGYLAEIRATKDWGAYISLESIGDWAKEYDNRYDEFVGAICKEAIAKREARVRDKSPEASAFWQEYRQLANQLLPGVDLTRLPSSVGTASPWPRFGAAVLPTGMLLEHKPQQGRVDLTFAKSTLETLKQQLSVTLPFEVKLEKAGQSAALRVAVPRVDHLRLFAGQEDEVLSIFAAVERLLAIGRQIASTMSGHSVTNLAR